MQIAYGMDSNNHTTVASLNLKYLNLQNVITFCTVNVGIFAILQNVRNSCNNSGVIIMMLMSGLVNEFYGVVTFQISKHNMSNEDLLGCVDFYPVSLVSINLTVFVTLLCAFRQYVGKNKFKLVRNLCLLYFSTVVITLVSLKPKPEFRPNFTNVELHDELIYMNSCRRNPYNDHPNIFLDYILLYIPFALLFYWLYKRQKRMDESFGWTEIEILGPCGIVEGSPHTCDICNNLNPALLIMLFYYGLVLLVARPGFIIYHLVVNTSYNDILPIITLMASYVVLSIYSIIP